MLSRTHHYARDRSTFDAYHVTDAQVSSGFVSDEDMAVLRRRAGL